MRIRSRLAILILAILLPALIGAAIGVGYLYREHRAFQDASMQETSRAFALALDGEIARRETMLRTLASSRSLAALDLRTFYAYASEIAAQHDSAIILSDLEGRQFLNTRLPLGARLPAMLAAERENRAKLGDEAVILSDVYLPPANLGPHSFAIQVPVRRDGKVTHFLTMASFTSQLQRLLEAQRAPQGWLLTVLDRQGVVAARSEDAAKFVGQPVREGLRSRLVRDTEGRLDGTNLSGTPVAVYFSRAPASGWSLVLSVPREVVYGAGMRTAAFMGAIALLLLALGLAAAWVVARRVAQPVEALRDAARRLGRGEPVHAPATGTVELDAVGHAMAEASDRLRRATTELEHRVAEAVASFERSQRALLQAQKLEALGRLTGGIAHDFNNLLQTLTAGLQALKLRAQLGPIHDAHEMLERCERAVRRGGELARQLMAFGRVQEVRVETLDTAAKVAEARHLLEGALRADIGLEVDLPAGLWPVTVDPAQLELALLNLVINARDAIPGAGRIALRARNQRLDAERGELKAGDYVEISVQDSGEGMSAEVMARALDPFFTTKGVGKGSGMGLPQAYGFARQSGGTLTLDSATGRGTTVRLFLPRATRAIEARAAPVAVPELPPSRGSVLLVEDDDEVRNTVSAALAAAGFDIGTAASADEALQRLDNGERYDAVLTDVVMPGRLSGVDLARHIRDRHPATGVVMATGYSDRAVELPGVRAVAKPYDVRQAVDALNAAMAERARTSAPR